MPTFRPLIALRCRSFDDFPTKLSRSDAGHLLKCWTAMWHPSVLTVCGVRPDIWEAGFSDAPLDRPAAALLIVPSFISVELAEEPQASTKVVFEPLESTRDELTEQLVQAVGAGSLAKDDASDTSEQRILERDDFFALGYAWLQVRLMTLQVRYSTNLDDERFDDLLRQAAAAWSAGDAELTQVKLTACFDLLLEEKNKYYSVQPELIDLVMLETTTLGPRFGNQLQTPDHLNVLATGEVLEVMAARTDSHHTTLQSRLAAGTATLVGGVQQELPNNLLPLETQLRSLLLGRDTAQRLLGVSPTVFARRRFGLTSSTPGLLEQLDFRGACHLTLDGGKLPAVTSSNIRWVGDDAQTIPALAVAPLDAADASFFLALGVNLARQIDSEHVATAVFAHWPDRTCAAFLDLKNATKYGGLLGDFVGLNDYFEAAYDPGYGDTFTAEQYESPLLDRLIREQATDPISRFVDHWQLHGQLQTCWNLVTMLAVKRPQANTASWTENLTQLASELNATVSDGGQVVDLQSKISAQRDVLLAAFAGGSAGSTDRSSSETLDESPTATLIVNGHSLAANASLVAGGIVEVPATGYQIVAAAESQQLEKDLCGPPIDDGLVLRNEFFQLSVDERTGGIRSVQTYADRHTQASQRLSIRLTNGKAAARYADMVAADVTAERVSAIESRIVANGQLLDPDSRQPLCRFTQAVTVSRRCRVAQVSVQLLEFDALLQLPQNRQSYVCSRLAWHDETAALFYGTPEIRHRVQSDWIEAPAYVRVEQPSHALTLITGGLPWHRRCGRKMLDSILVVGNEQRREFRFGIGSDCPRDLQAAIAWAQPPLQRAVSGSVTDSPTGWLFHFSSKNVVVSHSRPITESGQTIGVSFRLFETQGRRGKLVIACPFPIAAARRVTLDGRSVESLSFEARQVTLDFTRNEYFQINILRAL